jgi:hypothetical protein
MNARPPSRPGRSAVRSLERAYARRRARAKYCAADPGPRFAAATEETGVPHLRCTAKVVHRVRDASQHETYPP